MDHEVHTIRLTAAWERSEQGHWLRSFGHPSGLSCDHRVLLVVSHAVDFPALLLNGASLGAAESGDIERRVWDVTGRLTQRNTLEWVHADEDSDPPPAGRCPLPQACGEVMLEIFTTPGVNNA